MDADLAVELIKQHGVFALGGYEGCACTSFCVQGIHVDNSCRKSSGSRYNTNLLRVYSNHLDSTISELKKVAEAVSQSLRDSGEENPIVVRFCSYEMDKDRKCEYCHAPRSPEAYLCDSCKKQPQSARYEE